jgi:hypothetical protein
VSRVQAIETHYAGCRFRSRLEARVAVFLDNLHIRWEYEPQGYELPSGRYLPDFRVTTGMVDVPSFWIEVKGPVPVTREVVVASELNLYVGPLVILVGDIPRRRGDGTAWLFRATEDDPCEDGVWIMTDPETAILHTVYPDEVTRPEYLGSGPHRYEEALTAARSARFEYGERG